MLCAALLTWLELPAIAGSSADASELLARAQAAIEDVDFATAKKLVEQALGGGGMDPGELARAHRCAGEVAAALGDDDQARDHFVRWILLDPNAALAPGVSPKISAAFDKARKEAAGLGALRLSVRMTREANKGVVVVDAKDPVDLVAQIRVRWPDGTEHIEHGLRAEVPVDDTRPAVVVVTALDADGNAIWSDQVRIGARMVERRRGFPGWARWPTWAVVTGVGVAGGGFFVWRVQKAEDELRDLNRDSPMHTYDEAKDIEDRGHRDALLANVAFGVAGAAAIATVLTFVLEPKGVELVAAPTPGGGSVSATVRF
jgi:hypothetical protein